MDSYHIDGLHKSAIYAQMFRGLPAGLNEWAVHPGLDSAKLLAIERADNHIRQTDFDFLMSQEAQDVINEEGIMLLDYRPLQRIWRNS